jgi:SAM-dependent methyltransferase
MTATDRRRAEQLFHDRQAADRAAAVRAGRADLVFADAAYLDHETWVRPAVARLGGVRGKRVLDYGCGHGMGAVVFARAGAAVTAFDLSPGYVAEARERLRANGVAGTCVVADGEALPFPDGSFDAVWGSAILHHLDITRAGRELFRVLALGFARRFLPYPGKDRTPDEQPLTRRDLLPLREIFPTVEVEGYQLLGMVRRVWRNPRASRLLDALDAGLLRACPPLGNWCRYVAITLRKG